MAFGKRQLITIFGILVVALIAGGKRGQDTVTIPRPSLMNDYLLSNLPAQSFRMDTSLMILADGESTRLLSDVEHFAKNLPRGPILLEAAFALDSFRGAPALQLRKNFELPLSGFGNVPSEFSLVVVGKSKDLSELEIRSHALSFKNGRWVIESFDGKKSSEWITLAQDGQSSSLRLSEGLELAEMIVLSQPLSPLQAENISESLYRKWVDQVGL